MASEQKCVAPMKGDEIVNYIEGKIIREPWRFDCTKYWDLIRSSRSTSDVRRWMPSQTEICKSLDFAVCAPLLPAPIVWLSWRRETPFFKLRWYTAEAAEITSRLINMDVNGAIDYIVGLVRQGRILDPYTAFAMLKVVAMYGFAYMLFVLNSNIPSLRFPNFTVERYYDAVREVVEYYRNRFFSTPYRVEYIETFVNFDLGGEPIRMKQHLVLVPVFIFGNDENPLAPGVKSYNIYEYGNKYIEIRLMPYEEVREGRTVKTEQRVYALLVMDPVLLVGETLKAAVRELRNRGINIEIGESVSVKYMMEKLPYRDSDCENRALTELGFSRDNRPFVDAVTCIGWYDTKATMDFTMSASMASVPTRPMASYLWAYPIVVTKEEQEVKTVVVPVPFARVLAMDQYFIRYSGTTAPASMFSPLVLNYVYGMISDKSLYTSVVPQCSSLTFDQECINALRNWVASAYMPRPTPNFFRDSIYMQAFKSANISEAYWQSINDAAYLYFMGIMGISTENDPSLYSLLYISKGAGGIVISPYGDERGILGFVLVTVSPSFLAGLSQIVPMFMVEVTSISGTVLATAVVPYMDGRFLFELDADEVKINSYDDWLRAVKLTEPVQFGNKVASTLYEWLEALIHLSPNFQVPADPNDEMNVDEVIGNLSYGLKLIALPNNDLLITQTGINPNGYVLQQLYNNYGANLSTAKDDTAIYRITKNDIWAFVNASLKELISLFSR